MDYTQRQFSTPQVATLCRVTQRRIIALADMGTVWSSVRQASGHASRRVWAYPDALWALAVCRLAPALLTESLKKLGTWVESGRGEVLAPGARWEISITAQDGVSELWARCPDQDYDVHGRVLPTPGLRSGFATETEMGRAPVRPFRGVWLTLEIDELRAELDKRIERL